MNLIRISAVLLGVVLCWRPAAAGIVTYDFTATVTSQDSLGLSIGDVVTGSFSYDNAVPDFNIGNTTNGVYFQSQTLYFSVGALSASAPFDVVTIDDSVDANPDRLFAGTISALEWAVVLRLLDATQTVFVSDSLPALLPDLSAFDQRIMEFELFNDEPDLVGEFTANITSLTLREVSEPSSAALLGGTVLLAGLFAAGAGVRFRSRLACGRAPG